jgi:DNA-binding winged helix-turn-helix (wHTH) protein
MLAKTVTKSKNQNKQSFVRINIDNKLAKILEMYQRDYPLLSKADIIKMLLSQSIRANRTLAQVMEGADFLDIEDEAEQFAFLEKHGLM